MIDILLGACVTFTVPHVNGEIGSVRFINVVTSDPAGAPKAYLVEDIQAPYIDPPIGGWTYEPINTNDDIYYWDNDPRRNYSIVKFSNEEKVMFQDCPKDSRLKPGQTIDFTTLVVNTNTKEVLHIVDWNLDHQSRTTITFSGVRELNADIKKLISPWQRER